MPSVQTRAALFGVSEGGPMSILFAATYPERVQSLALYGTMARFTPELPDHPWGFDADEQARSIIEEIETHWGEGALADLFFGEIADVRASGSYTGASSGRVQAPRCASCCGRR